MNKFSIATVCVAVLAVSAVGSTPADAANLTRLDISGNVTVSSNSLPLLTGKPVTKVNRMVNLEVIIDNLAKRLKDEQDSNLTFLIVGYLDQYLPKVLPPLPSGISITAFSGQGSIFGDGAKTNFLSEFFWSYDSVQDILTVDGYDFSRIEMCLETTCYLSGASNQFSVSSAGVLIDDLKMRFNVAQTATPLGPNISQLNSITSFNTSQTNTKSVPEPASILGLFVTLGFGTLLKKQHFRRQANTVG